MASTRWRQVGIATLAGVGLGGCFLPVASGTPQAATTAGRGNASFNAAAEMPTIDLLADDQDDFAPVAAGVITAGYGITEHTDIEASAEAALYFFLVPLPTGGSIGLRHHLVHADTYDVGIAARVGGVTVDDGDAGSASAVYGAASVVGQGAFGTFRPLVSGQLMPTMIDQQLGTSSDGSSTGLVASATVGLMFQVGQFQIGPYLTGTAFSSDAVERNGLVSGGLSFAYRPDRHAAAVVVPAAAPAPPSPASSGLPPTR